ncbi:MAG: thiamine phosphate synthase [Terriglobia bacterium]|jgi:thiamine-phosphate pyrophosphorylase
MGFQLCYITDRKAPGGGALLPRIEAAVRAGVDLIQIRETDLPTRELIDIVRPGVEMTRGSSTRLVVNGRLDVALGLGAAGVHLGNHSLPAPIVREVVPPSFLVGVSCHSLEEALAAATAPADYILLGPIFETPSKLAYGPPLGLAKLREVSAQVSVPILALGGITVDRARACLKAGATGIAGISIFQTCASLERRVAELRAAILPESQ